MRELQMVWHTSSWHSGGFYQFDLEKKLQRRTKLDDTHKWQMAYNFSYYYTSSATYATTIRA